MDATGNTPLFFTIATIESENKTNLLEYQLQFTCKQLLQWMGNKTPYITCTFNILQIIYYILQASNVLQVVIIFDRADI